MEGDGEGAREVEQTPEQVTPSPPPASGRERAALYLLQLGALAVVLIATSYRRFELDRFFVPKELVLHLTALGAGLLALRSLRPLQRSAVDWLLAGFLLVSLISGIFATNPWLALRAATITASGLAVFWTARQLRSAGFERALLGALALAVATAALGAALQTYGVRSDLFSLNRAPGGTLGNRNFVAHAAAFGLPVLLLVSLRASRFVGFATGAVGTMLVAGMLVITRSRAGLLALAAAAGIMLLALVLAPNLRTHRRTWLRMVVITLACVAAVTAAVFVPNTLRWRSENPYLESVRSVANFQEGSGRGRMVQYRQSAKMMLAHPVVGVGPGNWAVAYPKYAARRDPSLDNNRAGMTANPWPSSDWVAHASERGPLAALLLLGAFALIALKAVQSLLRASSADEALAAAALLATVAAANVAALFDAVLLLALPSLLVWAIVGALYPGPSQNAPLPRALVNGVLILAAVGALRSTSQLASIAAYSVSESRAVLSTAALIDPSNYRLRVRLARMGPRAARCRHAQAARALYPNSGEARALASNCGR